MKLLVRYLQFIVLYPRPHKYPLLLCYHRFTEHTNRTAHVSLLRDIPIVSDIFENIKLISPFGH